MRLGDDLGRVSSMSALHSRWQGRVWIRAAGLAALVLASVAALPKEVPDAAVRVAVFRFELDDETPARALQNRTTSTATAMDKVSAAARTELAQSGGHTG